MRIGAYREIMRRRRDKKRLLRLSKKATMYARIYRTISNKAAL